MQLGILVIADADEEDAACVFGYLRRIFLALYLVYGGVSRMVEFKLHDECWLVYIAPGYHHEVSITFACSILSVDDVFVLRPYIGDGEHTGKGVLVVVGQDARVFVVGGLEQGLMRSITLKFQED